MSHNSHLQHLCQEQHRRLFSHFYFLVLQQFWWGFSSPCSPSPPDTQREIINPSTFWQTHFLTYSSDQNPLLFSPQKKFPTNPITGGSASVKEDIKLVIEVLLRKNKRRNTVIFFFFFEMNTVIVGDSVLITKGIVAELMSRLERGEVPGSHIACSHV
jgi:hypothetical protein